MTWTVYVLSSANHSATYVGIALDLERRLRQHNGELPGGARFTRARRPWTVAASYGPFETRSDAQRAEYQLKNLRGPARLEWEGLEDAPPA